MSKYISILENVQEHDSVLKESETNIIVDDIPVVDVEVLVNKLDTIIFKLKSHIDNSDIGFANGTSLASELIMNLISEITEYDE